ncbi:MAG: carbon-nitrogen hydrolase [Firmicutes bacterium]|nr:carbon-nitrogen hydrolase [Bacillota bacterium]
MANIKIALIQMKVGPDKDENIKRAARLLDEAAKKGADIAALPEMFNCPYSNSCFRDYGESYPGETTRMLSDQAQKNGMYIIGGSIPELDDDKVYNTSYTFDRKGRLVGKHRKVHLFDIDVKGKITFKESDVLTPGSEMTVFDTEWGKMGVMICYDIRFPEFTRKMALADAKAVFVPAAFNMTTGPAHWELTFRARALDNQIYMFGISSARNEKGYIAYGNSIAANSWGQVIGRLDEKEGILMLDVDLDDVNEVRESLPLLKHRRPEVY